MTALGERLRTEVGAKGARSGKAAPLPPFPQVNLLPPEFRAARALGALRRWLAVALVVVLLAMSGAYVLALHTKSAAEGALADANRTTADLQSKMTKYAEVPAVLADTTRAKQALSGGTGTEIMWKPYLDAITAVLPPNVSIDSFSLGGVSPLDAKSAASTDPLAVASAGSISFNGRSKTVPDTAAWLDALAGVPGFSQPWASSATVTEENGKVFYTVAVTVNLTKDALAQRFAAKDGK